MASNTPHLGLLKKDVTADANDTFNIETMLNQNWDKIDTGFKSVDEKVKNIDFSSLASKADLTTHNNVTATTAKKGHVQLSSTVDASETVAITPKGVSDAIQTVNATVAKKADQTTVDTALAKKADQASVVSSLATKADQSTVTEISNALATKAEQTTVSGLGGKVGTLEGLALQIQNGGRLGDYCQTVYDWNNAKTNGFYMGSSVTNAPTTEWFIGQVTAHNDIWCEQRVVAFSSSLHEYTRYLLSGSWTAWKRTTRGDLNALQFGSKTDIVTSMNELFQYADSGKNLVRNAVIGKDVWVNVNPTFQELAYAISSIGIGVYTGTLQAVNYVISTSSIPFRPKLLLILGIDDVANGGLYVERPEANRYMLYRYSVLHLNPTNDFLVISNYGFTANFNYSTIRPTNGTQRYTYIALTWKG